MNRVKKLVFANEAYRWGYTGKHIRIALLDTGVYAGHPDLRNRVIAFKDFVNRRQTPYDDNGHGTHIAGIMCGDGRMSSRRISGMAPAAELVVLKVLDEKGNGRTPDVLRAIEWVSDHRKIYNIRLLNFSVGFLARADRREQEELLCAIDRLWDDDVMVITAAGNNGPRAHSVTVPGISRRVVTVGASDDASGMAADLQRGYSGKGPTDCCIVKPEILAPGTKILSLSGSSDGYTRKSGTSMAAPVVCGALALAFEKRPQLTPAELKLKLYETVMPLKPEGSDRAWGILHVDNLIKMV